jgi:hypothetical protein
MSNKKEIWKTFLVKGKKPSVPYVISNHGRFGVLSPITGKVQVRTFKPTAGNYRFNTRQGGKNVAIFVSKEVALAFLRKPSNKHTFIIHKDHNYLNDHVDNLKWATNKEHRAHTSFSPNAILARQRKAIVKSVHSHVLNEKTVTTLKQMIWDPKRKLSYKQLADKFGVSEMQIYRIKTGQFWYHIRVANEPIHAKYKQNLSNIVYHEKKLAKEMADKKIRSDAKKIKSVKQKNAKASKKEKKVKKKDKSKKKSSGTKKKK